MMKSRKLLLISLIAAIIIIVLAVFFITRAPSLRVCEKDSDCVVFGETGDCNCGCYAQENMPSDSGGECFCMAPVSCACVDGACEGIFADMSKEEAIQIAENSECAGNLTDNAMYNSDTKTWWIDMTLKKEGCSPACVVREESKVVSINWRCTGAIPE